MTYAVFMDYVINYIYCYNEEHWVKKYSFKKADWRNPHNIRVLKVKKKKVVKERKKRKLKPYSELRRKVWNYTL
jgi:hypothetical protein